MSRIERLTGDESPQRLHELVLGGGPVLLTGSALLRFLWRYRNGSLTSAELTDICDSIECEAFEYEGYYESAIATVLFRLATPEYIDACLAALERPGSAVKLYDERFPEGSRVRIVALSKLEEFERRWKLHHPLKPDQLEHAGQAATVARIGFYHGGDVLYTLAEIPGTWHEECLEPPVD